MLFERLTRRQLVGLDCFAVVAFTLVAVGSAADGWVQLLPVVAVLPLAVRRLWPVPVLAATALVAAVSVAYGVVAEPFFAVAFALYTVAATSPRRRWVPTRAIGVLGGVGLVAAATIGPVNWLPEVSQPAGEVVLGLSVVCVGWALGRAVRERRDYTTRMAEQLADQAVTEERLRIARELHDVVAHSMSVITVKAGVAAHVATSRPEEVVDALRVIERTGRDALGEMRHILDVLRSDARPAELTPSPGLDRLDELVERAGMAGVQVDVDVRGAGHLPHGVELSVYRIVQEAVTNVVKHAAPARCRVRVSGTASGVRIDVTDDGPGVRVLPDQEASGHGLIGMRERVATYGGAFSAGPRDEGGYAVHAELPYAGSRR